MKIVKIIVAFMAFAMLATSAFGQELLLGSDGSVKKNQHAVEHISTGVDVSQSAWKYPEAIAKAYKNPNTPITVSWEKVVFEKPDFWHLTKVTKGEKAVVYDVDTASIQVVELENKNNEKFFDPFIIFMLISILLAVFSHLFLRKGKSDAAAIAAIGSVIATTAIAFGAALGTTTTTTTAIAFGAALGTAIAVIAFGAAIAIAILFDEGKYSKHYIYCVYYVFVAVVMILYLTAF